MNRVVEAFCRDVLARKEHNFRWDVLGKEYSGTVTLQTARSGKSRMDLHLSSGTRSEVKVNDLINPHLYVATNGTWTESAVHNSWVDANWFFPLFSTAAIASERSFVIASAGNSTFQTSANTSGQKPMSALLIQALSIATFDLDPTTQLPTRMRLVQRTVFRKSSPFCFLADDNRLLTRNPMLAVQIPRSKVVNRKKQKPHLSPEEFAMLLQIVPEPYATMVYVAVYTGLRVSELVGLKWDDVHADALTIDERYSRGDWSITKTEGSNATIGVDPSVIARILRLKSLEIDRKCWGNVAKKKIKLVRADGPQDLVFQSVWKGVPMRDGNILRRHLRPAALKLNMDVKKVTWRSLRTSCATWMVEAGANPKDVQGQLRHSRIGTTMEIYAQFVPESQRRAVALTSQMVAERVAKMQQVQSLTIN